MTFSKSDLISYLATEVSLSKIQAQKVVEFFFSGITKALQEGKDPRFVGFGTFSVQQTSARQVFNPRTREPIQIAASKKSTFKAGKELKEAVNKP